MGCIETYQNLGKWGLEELCNYNTTINNTLKIMYNSLLLFVLV